MAGLSISLSQAAKLLNGSIVGPNQILCADPDSDPRKRNMSVWVHPNTKYTVHSFRNLDWKYCINSVYQRLGIAPYSPIIPRIQIKKTTNNTQFSDERYRLEKISKALKLWSSREPIKGSLAEKYLASRKIFLTQEVLRSEALAFHPKGPFRCENGSLLLLPCMIALLTDAVTREPKGVHLTALKEDGTGKTDLPHLLNAKRINGSAKGCVIRLTPDEDVTYSLGLCEGIETGMALICAGWTPIWATYSAVNLKNFPNIGGIETLNIFCDHDANGTGQSAAAACAQKYRDAQREVKIEKPPKEGQDWLDFLTEGEET